MRGRLIDRNASLSRRPLEGPVVRDWLLQGVLARSGYDVARFAHNSTSRHQQAGQHVHVWVIGGAEKRTADGVGDQRGVQAPQYLSSARGRYRIAVPHVSDP